MAWQAALFILLNVAWTQGSAAAYAGQDSSSQIKTSCSSAGFGESYRAGEEFLHREKAATAVPYLEKAHQLCPSDYAAGGDLVIASAKQACWKRHAPLAKKFWVSMMWQNFTRCWESSTVRKETLDLRRSNTRPAELDPSEDNVFDFGSSLLKFEDDSALRVFRFGTEKYPDSEKMHLGLASALYGQGLIDQGVTEAYKASELNPADPEAMGLLGQMAHIPAGMSAAIMDGFSALSKLYPRNGRLTYYYAMALSGRWSDERAADSARVVELLKKATELDPNFAEAHFQLGVFYQEQDRSLDALHSYQEAARLDPEQGSYRYRLALAYKKCGYAIDYRREMQIYEKLHTTSK